MEQGRASRTAILVCQGRAIAHGRVAVGRFDDPTAMALLRDDEREAVETVRRGVPPRGYADRLAYEQLRASAEVMVPRTVAIDDAVRAVATPQVVILGAGLDGRAWRMAELAHADVFEVDHPASQLDKRERLGSLAPRARAVHFVPVDFTVDDLRTALAAAGHDADAATTWIWEGVVPYLTPAEVAATLDTIDERSAPGSRLVVNYQAPAMSATLGRLFAAALWRLARRGQEDPTAEEPRRSSWTPDSMRARLAGHHLVVRGDDDLHSLATTVRLEVRNRRSLAAGRVAVAEHLPHGADPAH